MSFSFIESGFASPDGVYRRGVGAADNSAAATAAILRDAVPPLLDAGSKTRVCMDFYEVARCRYGNGCAHAHHFSELNSYTQNKLLETVRVENIPKHFMASRSGGGSSSRKDTSEHGSAAPFHTSYTTDGNTAATAVVDGGVAHRSLGGPGERGKAGSHRRGKRASRPHDISGSATNFCDNSVSSLASSTDTFFLVGSVHESKDVSPQKGLNREEAAETFRIRLPPRCRYPHRVTRGTYYDVLGVQRTATQEEIIASYRRWQKEYKRLKQIDQQNADARDTVVVEARNVLGHPVLRSEYDRTLPMLWSSNSNCSREMARGAATLSSTNSSRSNNLEATASSVRVAKGISGAELVSLTHSGLADDSIW
ncbi:protein G2 [Trypanosoma conorhini]|uniref:Protein G2 n=1 Tax=Trypanosoma conorhini TaxID=83891 RepID=A0A3R7RC68_9TRYP|nr:protein G2 [Trypanosoma conorhini]RNE99556.1 protein G2 [Trypanosoma conorhini]